MADRVVCSLFCTLICLSACLSFWGFPCRVIMKTWWHHRTKHQAKDDAYATLRKHTSAHTQRQTDRYHKNKNSISWMVQWLLLVCCCLFHLCKSQFAALEHLQGWQSWESGDGCPAAVALNLNWIATTAAAGDLMDVNIVRLRKMVKSTKTTTTTRPLMFGPKV